MELLRNRAFDAEIMDDFSLPGEQVDGVLHGLGKMNALFGGHQSVIKALQECDPQQGFHISDWGCGGGDTLIAIAKWAGKNNINLKLHGVDASAAAVKFARKRSNPFPEISYTKADVLKHDFEEQQFDVVLCSLFSHHFDDEAWVELIRRMFFACRQRVVITDLHRHWVLYGAVLAITRLFTSNKMAQHDGPLSVRKSFKRSELVQLLAKADISNYRLQWKWAFRWRIIIYK
ncbi:methyltransferase domain-containing protein [Mucilaginibacter sp. RS28]|uniref:Methyltransferase domain-containing protein n=1 Tax=Mucilaginibacter straminoryzae TaxID=2932774 RepID=A0A9X1X5K4_9SPHI|nr:methyltransferase domain-containing protein [Mucilaginibacter straminoryzae]MCJ8210475.1 methyltransferase domain-containing protein [Mucilaginibacter straminoryzae]